MTQFCVFSYVFGAMGVGGVIASVLIFASQYTVSRLIPWRIQQTSRERKKARDITRQYTDPIASSALDLLRRLQEIKSSRGRSDFLLRPDLSDYSRYKFKTTMYRLGALLGWIYSFRREMFYFPRMRRVLPSRMNKRVECIEKAIEDVRKALADGASVEKLRVEKLAKLWKLNVDCEEHPELGVNLELCIDECLNKYGAETNAHRLDSAEQLELCRAAYRVLFACTADQVAGPDPQIDCRDAAIEIIGIRESWLFRDWQDMIGSQMVRKSDVGGRLFEVINMTEFEEHYVQEPTPEWMFLLRGLFEGVDMHNCVNTNVRRTQLCELLKAAAGLVLAIQGIDKHVFKETANLSLDKLQEIVAG